MKMHGPPVVLRFNAFSNSRSYISTPCCRPFPPAVSLKTYAGILDFGPSGAATVSRPLSAPWNSRCSPVDCYFFLPRLEQGPMSSAILGPAARSRTALAGKPGNLRLHCLVACAGKPGNLRFHRLAACAGKPGNLQIRRLVAWAGKPGNLRFHSLGVGQASQETCDSIAWLLGQASQ